MHAESTFFVDLQFYQINAIHSEIKNVLNYHVLVQFFLKLKKKISWADYISGFVWKTNKVKKNEDNMTFIKNLNPIFRKKKSFNTNFTAL